MKKIKRNMHEHNDWDRQNSWYWNVLVKECGSWHKAEKMVLESQKRADPMRFLNYYNE